MFNPIHLSRQVGVGLRNDETQLIARESIVELQIWLLDLTG